MCQCVALQRGLQMKVLSGSPQLNVTVTVAAVCGLQEQKDGRCEASPNMECQHVGAVAVVL